MLLGAYSGQTPQLLAVPAVALVAVGLAAAEWIRPAGKRAEVKLKRYWGGLPTTQRLSLRNATNTAQRVLHRAALEALSGERLPTAADEGRDFGAAEVAYEEIVRRGIARVVGDGRHAGLLNSENVSYGFRRNTYAIRTVSMVLLIAAIATSGFVAIASGQFVIGLILCVPFAALLCFWTFAVTEVWVRDQADELARRFFVAAVELTAPTRKRLPRTKGRRET